MPKILIADDSAFMRTIIARTLRDNDFDDIIEAQDGGEAVTMFVDHKPDIVLLDINMPVKDGMQVLREIAPLGAKVIMISAIGQEQFIQEAMTLGARDYFIKPHSIKEDLAVKIMEILQNP